MNHYTIPNTPLKVSRIAFGTWHLGGSWDTTPLSQELKDRANSLVQACEENGINHIDLADIYTKGKSDSAIGFALAQNPGLRDKLILQEKTGIILGDDPNPGDPGRYEFTYDNIVSKVETSLKRLGTDRVEILALHRPDPLIEYEEVAKAIDHLHTSGKVLHFGVSNHTWAQIETLKKYVDQPLVVNQLELNLIHNYLIADGVTANMVVTPYANVSGTLDYCRANDIMIQAWSPVAGGAFLDHPALKAELETIGEKHGVTGSAVAVAWLLRHPAGIQPILGTKTPSRITETVTADTIQLTRVEWYRLLAAARGAGVP